MNDVVTNEKAVEKAAQAQVSRELSVVHHGNASVPMPSNFEQMTKFASLMAQGANMVGPAFRDNPGACLGALIQSMRWGMDPYSCSQKMYIASKSGEGPIAYEAQLVHAVILTNAPLSKRPRCTYTGEGPSLRCHVVFHVRGEDEPLTYDSPPLSKVKKNSPLWVDDPEQQLWYYSVRAGARRHFPDVIMGVYTPDEVAQIAETQTVETKNITLSGAAPSDTNNIPEAEFSDGTIVLEKNAKAAAKKKPKEPVKEKGASPVTAAQEDRASTGETEAEGGSSSVTPTNTTPAAEPNEPQVEDEAEVAETDAQIIARVSSEIRAAPPTGKSQPIRDARGALTRIAEMSEDKKLAAKAEQILNLYDLD